MEEEPPEDVSALSSERTLSIDSAGNALAIDDASEETSAEDPVSGEAVSEDTAGSGTRI